MCGRDSIDLTIYLSNVHLMYTHSGMIPKTMSMNDVTSYMTICAGSCQVGNYSLRD